MFPTRRACVVAAIALGVGGGCGGSSKKTNQPSSKSASDAGRTVRNVKISGNTRFGYATLVSGLANRPPSGRLFKTAQPYDPIELARDRARLESYYKARGYFRARVVAADVQRIGSSQVDLAYKVHEGLPTKIRSIVVRGAPNRRGLRTKDLVRAAGLKLGAVMVYDDYGDAKGRIRSRLVRAGYAFAKVRGKVRVDRRVSAANVIIEVDPGPRAMFGKANVVGLKLIPERSVRARFSWQPGQPFRSAKLAESRRRLYALGVFSTVTFEYDKQRRPEVADLTVRLQEGPRHEIKLGGGAGIDNTRYELRGRAVYQEKGFVIPLLTLRFEARPSFSFLRDGVDANDLLGLGFEASAGLSKEDFLSPLWRADSTLTYTAREFTAYSIQGPRLVLSIARKLLGDRLRVGLAWQFRLQQFLSNEVPTAAERTELGIETPYRLGVFQQSISYDGRDNPITPRSGIYASLRLEESGSYAGSNFSYVRVLPEIRGYLSLGDRVVVAARGRLGRTLSSTVLPITERFFVGGASSQRGFGLQRLSPRIGGDLVSAPVGGRAMVETGVEARLNMFRFLGSWFGLAGFVDGGDATRDPTDLSLTNLHWAAGFGFRYQTVIGPIRTDVAWRLNRMGTGTLDASDAWAWHISLGEAF